MAEQAIILGLAMTAFIFAYYAFQLRESDVENNQRVAVLLAFVSLLFVNLLFYATYLVAQNSAPYLSSGLLERGLLVMVWTTNLLLFYMLAAGVYGMIRWLWKEGPKAFKAPKDRE